MNLPNYSRAYEKWAPVIGRILLGLLFLNGAYFKIPGTEKFIMEVGFTASAGFPFPEVAVTLAFLLELIAGIALVIGWQARTAALLLAIFTIILNLVFFRNLADPTKLGFFLSNLAIIGGLFYVSVYGTQHAAVAKDTLPKS